MPQRSVGAIPNVSMRTPWLSAPVFMSLRRSAEVSDVLGLKSPAMRRYPALPAVVQSSLVFARKGLFAVLVDDAARRAAAEQHRGRAAQQLDPIEVEASRS